MASVNACRCPSGIAAQRDPLLNVKSEQCGDIRNMDSCRPVPIPDPCKPLEKPQTFGLNLNLQSMTGQDYSSATGCQLVRSANIIEWDQMNDRKVFGARSDKENSEMLRELSKRQQDECLTTSRHRAADTTKKLGERLRDTNYWKFELERLLEDMRNEIDLMLAQKNRLRNSLNASQVPYMIVTDSLDTRRRRIDGDLVTDQLDVALMKEMDVIKRARDLLEDTSVTADRVLAADRRCKEALEHDWSDKYQASRIDSAAGELTPSSTNIKPYPGVRAFHPGQSTLEEWREFTQRNQDRAEEQRCESTRLRHLIDRILQEVSRDMLAASDETATATERRIQEVIAALQRLETELREVIQEIVSQEQTIADLKQAIDDLERPLMVAQTRTQRRGFRPNVEESRDHPQCSLSVELLELPKQIALLRQRLSDAQRHLQTLLNRRCVLENDVAVKRESLRIDKEKIRVIRSRYPSSVRLNGY
ncbi:tektin-4-like isoform X2 [Amphibalanus amphitrite]|uniref:tektin-4-like isoform X2 n=1 Tax=Amphibalanus amphitrite TaxID=1232801 RepID=UPI001C910436|nr:tektin-4-like isoform X2 [Amphibalanus amphitrite]